VTLRECGLEFLPARIVYSLPSNFVSRFSAKCSRGEGQAGRIGKQADFLD